MKIESMHSTNILFSSPAFSLIIFLRPLLGCTSSNWIRSQDNEITFDPKRFETPVESMLTIAFHPNKNERPNNKDSNRNSTPLAANRATASSPLVDNANTMSRESRAMAPLTCKTKKSGLGKKRRCSILFSDREFARNCSSVFGPIFGRYAPMAFLIFFLQSNHNGTSPLTITLRTVPRPG